MKRVALIYILLMFFANTIFAQTGTIKGTITDKETKEPLTGASILIEGSTKGTVTDFDGNFTLEKVPAGAIKLRVSFISYEDVVKDIKLADGQTSTIDFALATTSIGLNEVSITGKKNRESESALLIEQKKAIIASQSIGSQELSRKGVSDAEGAVTKISGISKQEGIKNVFVRGLGDRYNITTLNGFILPSEDPEYKNISLDFFSNDIIQSVAVKKVFSSSMHGDVGGAVIDIQSKELIGDSEFEIGISSSLNTESIGKDILLPEGLNFWGYSTATYGSNENMQNYAFNNSLDPVKSNKPNLTLSFSGGRKFLNKHRFFVAGSMGNSYRYEEGELREITSSGAANPFVNMTYTRTLRNASNLLLGNLELNFNKFRVSYNALFIHSGSAYHADLFGKHSERFQRASDESGYTRRQQINDNSIVINQILVNGEINKRLNYFIGASVNNILGKEPDRRVFRFPSIGSDRVELHPAENVNERFYSKINELAINPKFNFQYKLSDNIENSSLLVIGYDALLSNKKFNAPIYNHTWNPTLDIPEFNRADIKLDKVFNPNALSTNQFELELFNDTYRVDRIIHAAYVDFIFQINNSLTLNSGLRFDYMYLKINYEVNRGQDIGTDILKDFQFSPNLNLKYVVNDKNHLRIGASRTYTIPQDKEISPFVYYGFDGPISGNPKLKIATNYNVDVKWDYYMSNSELISVNGFYKYLLNPIARVDVGNSAGVKTYDNVSDHAIAAGLEVEFRKKLWSLENRHNITMGLNASYIHSEIKLDPNSFVQNSSSTLEGAAPYILNADITYNLILEKFTMNSAFVVNYLSDKVHTIGSRGYNNLIEESITTIDFVNSIKIDNKLVINFKAMNLLNPLYRQTREGATDVQIPSVVIRSYKKGIQLSFGLTYKF
jgi:hypothetical protein